VNAQGVIRLVKPSGANGATAEEKIVACGRGTIKEVAADAAHVVWSESGTAKGVFIAPR
jgi:hypothetical protein